jgi:homeobox-leucine zipper protein
MNEEMHILSPLVRPREFNIIRYCRKVDAGVWVITDVSFDSSRPNTAPLSRGWKHPSGCIIREMPHGGCLVSSYYIFLRELMVTTKDCNAKISRQ